MQEDSGLFRGYLNKLDNKVLMMLAAKMALMVAGTLFFLKILAWLYTDSITLKLSCLDSGFDIGISTINFLILYITIHRRTHKFVYGYDKAAALASAVQACIMLMTVSYTIYEATQENNIQYNHFSVIILLFSTLLSAALLSFQEYVVKRTGSMIVKADMLHYKTDVFINLGSVLSLVVFLYTGFSWVDSVIAIVIAIYLLIGIFKLIRQSVFTLMDRYISEEHAEHKAIMHTIESYNVKVKKLNVIFSGAREVIYMTLLFDGDMSVAACSSVVKQIEEKIRGYGDGMERVIFTSIETI